MKTPVMVLAGRDFPLTWHWFVANYPSDGQKNEMNRALGHC